jgi:hypothetical protein
VRAAGSLVLVAVTAAFAAPAASGAVVVQRHIVPPGVQVLSSNCEGVARSPANVRFVFAGPADVEVSRIRGNVGFPDILFSPSASLHEVTAFFAQNPISESQSVAFDILVNNPLERSVHLTVAIFCDEI